MRPQEALFALVPALLTAACRAGVRRARAVLGLFRAALPGAVALARAAGGAQRAAGALQRLPVVRAAGLSRSLAIAVARHAVLVMARPPVVDSGRLRGGRSARWGSSWRCAQWAPAGSGAAARHGVGQRLDHGLGRRLVLRGAAIHQHPGGAGARAGAGRRVGAAPPAVAARIAGGGDRHLELRPDGAVHRRDGAQGRTGELRARRPPAGGAVTRPPYFYPFSFPANVWFAWREGLPVDRYDLLAGEPIGPTSRLSWTRTASASCSRAGRRPGGDEWGGALVVEPLPRR